MIWIMEKFDFDQNKNKSKQILISLIVVWPTVGWVVKRAYNPSTESQL